MEKLQRLAPLEGKKPGELIVHEIYRSIQGESTFAGLPCVFVRLTACLARCTWCDTPHAFNEGKAVSLEEVIERVLAFGCPLVEITGGEPLLQEETLPLMARLADGRTVLQSTMMDPLAAVSARPSLPRITLRDISVLPTQRKMKSLCRATSAGVAHAIPPLAARVSTFALVNDHRAT